MGTQKNQDSWVDRWWPLLLIILGAIFISILALFHPVQ
jgi:hypothetical protein